MGFGYLSPPLNAHAGVSSGARSPNADLSINLLPYFVHARNGVSGETVWMGNYGPLRIELKYLL